VRRAPRFFPSHLDPVARRVYGATALFFLLVFLGLVWPVYPLFAGVRPLVLGVPFSLYYVVVLLHGAFLVLLGLFVWEGRRRVTGTRPESGRAESPPGGRERGEEATRGRASGGTEGEPGRHGPGERASSDPEARP